jgi:hypothetical protein
MTLPDERYRAVVQTRRFLLDLCNIQQTPRIPKRIRETARAMLRHYPSEWEMNRAAISAPDIFQERLEPLAKMILQYKQDVEEEQNDKTI